MIIGSFLIISYSKGFCLLKMIPLTNFSLNKSSGKLHLPMDGFKCSLKVKYYNNILYMYTGFNNGKLILY